MSQTKIEQLLAGFLRTSTASKPTQAIAYLMMETEAQQLELCRYLDEHETATDSEIMAAAKRIAGE